MLQSYWVYTVKMLRRGRNPSGRLVPWTPLKLYFLFTTRLSLRTPLRPHLLTICSNQGPFSNNTTMSQTNVLPAPQAPSDPGGPYPHSCPACQKLVIDTSKLSWRSRMHL